LEAARSFAKRMRFFSRSCIREPADAAGSHEGSEFANAKVLGTLMKPRSSHRSRFSGDSSASRFARVVCTKEERFSRGNSQREVSRESEIEKFPRNFVLGCPSLFGGNFPAVLIAVVSSHLTKSPIHLFISAIDSSLNIAHASGDTIDTISDTIRSKAETSRLGESIIVGKDD
jgi:hypothetical protein